MWMRNLVLLVLASHSLSAAILSPSGIAKEEEKGGLKISIPETVRVEWDSSIKGKTLQLLGSGVREKKVAFFTADVYFAKAYATNKPAATDTLERAQQGVLAAPVKAIELVFLRDVSADKIKGAFGDSLKENGIVLGEGSLEQTVLDRITSEIKKAQTLRLIGTASPEKETLVMETPDASFAVEGKEIATNFFKIWFGKTSEGKLRDLQRQLVGLPPA